MLRKTAKRLIAQVAANDYQTLNRIELSEQNLLHNVNFVQDQHKEQAVIPVLKSNAYGHGLAQIASMLNRADVPFLAVDGYFEAAKLRDITRHRLLVMGYIAPANTKLLDTKRCAFVVQDVAGLHAFGKLRRQVAIHLELNTGMYRLGLNRNELDEYLQVLKHYPTLQLEGVMTHLADADNDHDSSFTVRQAKAFDEAVEYILAAGFKPKYFHVAQTAGSTKLQSRYANAIRLGIGLYGVNPLQPDDPNYSSLQSLRPVLRLVSTVIKVHNLQKGDVVSYNGTFVAPRAMRIGVVPLGYYEGVPRELSNTGVVTYHGRTLPIVGRICMNHTMIQLDNSSLNVGDEVIVISNEREAPNSVAGIARTHDLFEYSLLVNLSSSIRRMVY